MNKLGIIGAMAVEVESLKAQMEDLTVVQKAGMEFYDGVLEGLRVVVVQCGVGKVNAAMCAQVLCDCFDVTHLVNTGIAGSLCAELDIGDLLISRDAMYHDFDAQHFGYEMGEVPGMGVLTFEADADMIALASAAAEAVNPGHSRVGRVASGDLFVAEKAVKEAIIAKTNALCTKFDSFAYISGSVAFRNKLPFVILRDISDKADDSAEMDYPTFEAIAARRCAQVARIMAKKLCQQ